MTPGTTIPAGIGVWEGARVVINAPGYLDIPTGTVGTVAHRGRMGGWEVATCPPDVWSPRTYLTDVEDLHLDLTHRPTRLEVIERWRVVTPRTTGGISGPWFSRMHRPNVQYLACGDLHAVARPVGRPSYLAYAVVVPALADLDPTDDTRLPDGARVVDVQALAIVLRQVFGVAR